MTDSFFLGVINHMHITLIINLSGFFKLLSAHFGPTFYTNTTHMNTVLQLLLSFVIICPGYKELHLSTNKPLKLPWHL